MTLVWPRPSRPWVTDTTYLFCSLARCLLFSPHGLTFSFLSFLFFSFLLTCLALVEVFSNKMGLCCTRHVDPHYVGHAHGQLQAATLLVDREHCVWILDMPDYYPPATATTTAAVPVVRETRETREAGVVGAVMPVTGEAHVLKDVSKLMCMLLFECTALRSHEELLMVRNVCTRRQYPSAV